MKIYCNLEILSALSRISFPKDKNEILFIAETSDGISESSIICLNKIDDKIYYSIDEICENIKIVCSLELRDALEKIKFPATKRKILKEFADKNYSQSVIEAIKDLSEDQVFDSVSDICI